MALLGNNPALLHNNLPLLGNKWHLSFVKTVFSKYGRHMEEKISLPHSEIPIFTSIPVDFMEVEEKFIKKL